MNQRVCNVLLGVLLLCLSAYVVVESLSFSEQAAQLPRLLAGLFTLLGLILVVTNLHPVLGASAAQIRPFAGVRWRIWLVLVVALVLFGLGAGSIGFYESALVFLLATTWLLNGRETGGARRLIEAATFAVVFDAALYVAFEVVLQVATPRGLLF